MTRNFFFNQTDIVSQAIGGNLAVSSGTLARVDGENIFVRSDYESNKNKKVAIISGGGSGHEPLHAGFVGHGMLSGAVCGEIFASPSVKAILTAIHLLTGDRGCLLIVKNYTGDRLNFALAAEQARARGKKVEILLVADDIAIEKPEKRRGIAGAVFLHKIAGYLSEQGYSLDEIKRKCEEASAGLFSIGLSISGADSLTESETARIEPQLGRGIHNEAGKKFTFTTNNIASEAVENLVENFLERTINNSCQYVIAINNLGGLTDLEMAIITVEVLNSSLRACIKYIVGPSSFCTALNMKGFSLSLLALTDEIEEALLSPVEPRAWVKPVAPVAPERIDVSHNLRHQYTPSENQRHRQIIHQIADVLITSEDVINELDSYGGDADCGSTLFLAATSIKEALDEMPLAQLDHLLLAIGEILSSNVGGSSGVLFSILFTNAGQCREAESLPQALMQGVRVMMEAAGSDLNDRSFLDALVPAIEILQTENLYQAAVAARTGANRTASMVAKVGRVANVPRDVYQGFNDAGAEAIAIIFERLAEI